MKSDPVKKCLQVYKICKYFNLSIILQVHIEFRDSGDVIKIEGPPEDANKSKEILETQSKELIDKMSYVEINVDSKYHKHIIGKGGSTGNYQISLLFVHVA